jgi:heterodisulfide reductase subunit A
MRVLSHDKWAIDPIVAYVWPDRCVMGQGKKCGLCESVCPYGAIVVEPGKPTHIIPAKCHGCGTCVAECPHNAITQRHFSDGQVMAQIHAMLADNPEGKVLAFMCRWCSGMGCDNAGTSHFEYPANTRAIMVMCAGRVDTDFVMEAFRLGAGAVLVSGCHPQDCHYIKGRQYAEDRMGRLAKQLEKMGISPQRFRVESVSATEGAKWAQILKELNQVVQELKPEGVKRENEEARPQLNKRLTRFWDVPGVGAVLQMTETGRQLLGIEEAPEKVTEAVQTLCQAAQPGCEGCPAAGGSGGGNE